MLPNASEDDGAGALTRAREGKMGRNSMRVWKRRETRMRKNSSRTETTPTVMTCRVKGQRLSVGVCVQTFAHGVVVGSC